MCRRNWFNVSWLVWYTAHVHGETGPMKGLLPTPYWWMTKIRSSKSPDPNLLLTPNSCAQECDTAVCGFFFFPLARPESNPCSATSPAIPDVSGQGTLVFEFCTA